LRKNLLTSLFFIFLVSVTTGQTVKLKKYTVEEYVQRYAAIAKAEMRRTGIPASIKLAQGILESSFGNSPLATEANNHFGIKCHTGYQGKGYYMNDDAENECFRIYDKPEDSYYDHSEFLRTRPRYADLFKLDPKDYKGWAKGLKEAGYATNPQYSNLIIRMIEERNLHQFDTADPELSKSLKTEEDVIKTFENKIVVFNGLKTVIAQPKQTFVELGEKFGVSYKNMKKYNEYTDDDSNYYLIPGSKVYLQTKKTKGVSYKHKVQENETMHSIAQKEAIKISKLYEYNLMNVGEEPAVGEELMLQKKGKNRPKLKSQQDINKLYEKIKRLTVKNTPIETTEPVKEVKEEIKIEEPKVIETKKDTIVENKTITTIKNEPLQTVDPTQKVPIFHIVEPKQTLYSISLMYNVRTTALMDMNNLKTIALEPNQKLIVGYETDKIKTAADLKVKTTERAPIIHLVKPRETIHSISEWYNIKPDDIKRWNNLPNFNLKDSMEIIVGYINPQQPKPVQPEIKEDKPAIKDTIANVITNGKKFPQYHIVAPGETLYSISKKYNIPVEQLMKMNEMSTTSLNSGQRVVVGYEELKTTEKKPEPIVTEKKPEPKPEVPQKVEEKPKQPIETNKPVTNENYHIVQKGETLYAVSRKYNVSVEDLIRFNNMSSTSINEGQKLLLKPNVNGANNNTVKQPTEPIKVNVQNIPETKTETVPNAVKVDGIKYHTVQPGETLYRLSVTYKISIEKLQEWNNLTDFTLKVGQQYIVGK
jgi:LysM repeat protein